MVVLILAISLMVVPVVILGALQLRSRRRPAELRGDWFAKFEREFRAYAATAQRPRDSRRRTRPERSPKDE